MGYGRYLELRNAAFVLMWPPDSERKAYLMPDEEAEDNRGGWDKFQEQKRLGEIGTPEEKRRAREKLTQQ